MKCDYYLLLMETLGEKNEKKMNKNVMKIMNCM